MKLRLKLVPFAAAAAALALAACGSNDNNSGNAAAAGDETVSVADVDGVGKILVDSSGQALYAADEEANGQVKCTDGCTSFWKPLEPGADAPTAGPGVPKLAAVDRPDGTTQVTAGGQLLYTFAQDSAGQVKGDGVEDDFGGQHLTWHAVRASGGGTTSPGTTAGGSSTGSSGGYGDYGGYGG